MVGTNHSKRLSLLRRRSSDIGNDSDPDLHPFEILAKHSLARYNGAVATFNLRPTHKPVQAHYATLRQFGNLGASHESAVTVPKGGFKV